jgi:hypothetical protein
MGNLKNETLSEQDLISLETENNRLRKEVWILRIFAICVTIILLYNMLHK